MAQCFVRRSIVRRLAQSDNIVFYAMDAHWSTKRFLLSQPGAIFSPKAQRRIRFVYCFEGLSAYFCSTSKANIYLVSAWKPLSSFTLRPGKMRSARQTGDSICSGEDDLCLLEQVFATTSLCWFCRFSPETDMTISSIGFCRLRLKSPLHCFLLNFLGLFRITRSIALKKQHYFSYPFVNDLVKYLTV